MFFVCIVGIVRCFVSMLLTSILNEPHKDSLLTKVLMTFSFNSKYTHAITETLKIVNHETMQDGRSNKGIMKRLRR